MSDPVTSRLQAHYARAFAEHGATAKGVDWGRESDVELRYAKMLAVMQHDHARPERPSLLDVGCGYAGLYTYAEQSGVALDYLGIDVVEGSVAHAKAAYPELPITVADVFDDAAPTADYVVCNGILTQKLETSLREMDAFAHRLVRRLFALARRGIAFNVMSTHVNFTASNLYYRSPVELLAFCTAELSRLVVLDHAYPLYEYTLYVYKEP